MRHLLYFIPGNLADSEILSGVLKGRFDVIQTRQTTRGPLDLPPGKVVCDGSITGERLALDINPGIQTWHKSADGRFAFGWWNDDRPGPSDLRVKDPLDGTEVNGWLVPRVRKGHLEGETLLWTNQLPVRPKWDGQRFVAGDVVARWAHVANLASEVIAFLDLVFWETNSLPIAEASAMVAKILQINHRVGCDELAALEAFELSFDSLTSFLKIFVSYDQYIELLTERQQLLDGQKKTG